MLYLARHCTQLFGVDLDGCANKDPRSGKRGIDCIRDI